MPIDHLPPRLHPFAERVRGFLLTDATVLLILGAECVWRGSSYLANPPRVHSIERFFPLEVWAVVWVAVGVGCAVSTVRVHSPVAALMLSLAVGLNVVWAGSLTTNSWGSGGTYWAISTLVVWSVWRGYRTEIRIREVGE